MPQHKPRDRHRPHLLLVHGAWHGPWCWEDLLPVLDERGWRTHTVDLPSGLDPGCAEPVLVPGLYSDAAAIAETLAAIAEPVVVVAHSYGGAPVTEACAQVANVDQLIYLAAFQLDVGESVRTSMGADPRRPIPTTGYSEPAHASDMYSDVPADIAARAIRRLRLQSDPSRSQRIGHAAWRTVRSSYVICDNDAVITPSRQAEFATRATATYHLPSGHSPFYSLPRELADLLGRIVCGATQSDLA